MSASPSARKRRKAAPRRATASSLSREEFIVRRISEIEADQDAIRGASSPSWIALGQLGRALDECHAELISLRTTQGDQSQLDPAQLVAGIEAAIKSDSDGLPEEDVERLYLACCDRLGFAPGGGVNP